MAIVGQLPCVNSGRQQRVESYVDIAYNDLGLVSGSDFAIFWLPAGATDIKGTIAPITAFNSATSDVLDVGNDSSQNAYKNDFSIAATTPGDLTGLPLVVSQGFWVSARWVGVGAVPSAGLVRIFYSYILEERSQFDHGPSKWPS